MPTVNVHWKVSNPLIFEKNFFTALVREWIIMYVPCRRVQLGPYALGGSR